MECQITNECDVVADEVSKVVTEAADVPEPGDTDEAAAAPSPAIPVPVFDGYIPVESVLTIDTMGSGDAPAPLLVVAATLTARDVQDMILPDPSIVNLLPPLNTAEQPRDSDSSTTNDIFHPTPLFDHKVN